MPRVSVVIPTFNEADNLPVLVERLGAMANGVKGYDFEFVFVDDGSRDATPMALAELRKKERRIKALRFSRNFGSHAACLAGLVASEGDLAVIIAADLQDPPELIPQMLERMEQGADVVLAVRNQREDPWLTVKFANTYHRLMRRFAIAAWPASGADVVMVRRALRDVVVRWRQKNTSLFAQIMWSGFRQATLTYDKQKRHAGRSHWTLGKKIKLFVDSFVSFSFTPIRLISYSGMAFSALGFGYAAFVILNKMFFSQPIAGWSSLMAVLLLVSGFQQLMLGVIGEYLWRVADEVRGSPAYVVESRLGFEPARAGEVDPWMEAGAEHARENLMEFKAR